MNFETLCVQGAKDKSNTTGAIAVPIYQSATFSHPGVNQSTGYDYSRLQNPTREALENVVAKLEGGVDAMAFSSGMAAISVLMELFSAGDHIIASSDLYGGSIRFFNNISRKSGIEIEYVDTSDLKAVGQAIKPATKAIFIETPTNPMMDVTDIAAIKRLTAQRDILIIVDNTFLTPYYQQPLSQGADIAVHSGTKYLAGHNDTLAGFLVVSNKELSERLRFIYKTIGSCLSPFDSFLVIRGIKTLAIRMDRAQENAKKVANWLLGQPMVKAVHYIGLDTHPDIEITKRQSKGFGSMVSFEVESKELACHILENVKMIMFAESLGGVETLITYPHLQTHADVPKHERDARGITDRLLRLSIGIENCDDIISDLKQAINSF
ncbi:MAG: PLP-dependent aspartate aminotransferase family protein [Eubacteriales bacterium]|jgi:cystathionine beta-lyase/cystathionine gamma-synthase|nr:PLP-dependent aspartate aminotransferase family protein [Eubacteriales bacterium]